MTPEQIALVQEGFRRIEPIQILTAELFYGRLFELDPALEGLFHGDLTQQCQNLMAALTVAVRGLDDLETILPVIRDLGRRHVGYGVERHHYETVATALLWALEQGLGKDFTADARQAWAAAYGLLSSAMIQAGEAAAA